MNERQKLYDLLIEWYRNEDFCQSSHVIVNELIDVIKKWIPENKEEVLYGDGCYNEALNNLRNSLR